MRKQGKSYNQIKQEISVSKSTLSNWLKEYPLSKELINGLRANSEQRIERFRKTMERKHAARLKEVYETEKKNIFPLSDKEIFIFGLGLYWGEGTKREMKELSISNNDPALINFFIYWLEKSFNIPRKRIKILLHLYSDMDIKKEMVYWSKILNIPLSQFNKPYIKKTSAAAINHKGSFGHGTCNAGIGSVPLAEKIIMGIKTIADNARV